MTQGERENRQKEEENKEMGEMEAKPRQRHTDTWTQRYRDAEVLRYRGTEEQGNTKMAKIRPGATNGRTASDQKNGQNR